MSASDVVVVIRASRASASSWVSLLPPVAVAAPTAVRSGHPGPGLGQASNRASHDPQRSQKQAGRSDGDRRLQADQGAEEARPGARRWALPHRTRRVRGRVDPPEQPVRGRRLSKADLTDVVDRAQPSTNQPAIRSATRTAGTEPASAISTTPRPGSAGCDRHGGAQTHRRTRRDEANAPRMVPGAAADAHDPDDYRRQLQLGWRGKEIHGEHRAHA